MDVKTLISTTCLALIDVRSEAEFTQGHIPGAYNIPLLNNEERKQVGICFKQKGKDEAIHLGYKLVGHQFSDKLRNARKLVDGKRVGVYCWRGGMRSKIFGQILENGGFEVARLHDGYKAFRNWVLKQFNRVYPLIILGGATGSGKTELLNTLGKKGEQVIDLEGLANHKGSTYGGIGMKQPTNEHFENELAVQLNKLQNDKPIWVENESRQLGKIKLPDAFYEQMRIAKLVEVELPLHLRIERILKEYAILPKDELIEATAKLERRLGNQKMNQAIKYLIEDEYEQWIELMLGYYDENYAYGNSLRNKADIHTIRLTEDDTNKNAALILKHYDEYFKRNTSNTLNPV